MLIKIRQIRRTANRYYTCSFVAAFLSTTALACAPHRSAPTGAATELQSTARELWRHLNARLDGGQPASPEFVDLLCRTSENLADADLRAGTNALVSRSQHLRRLDELKARFDGIKDAPPYVTQIISYHLAKAAMNE